MNGEKSVMIVKGLCCRLRNSQMFQLKHLLLPAATFDICCCVYSRTLFK